LGDVQNEYDGSEKGFEEEADALEDELDF